MRGFFGLSIRVVVAGVAIAIAYQRNFQFDGRGFLALHISAQPVLSSQPLESQLPEMEVADNALVDDEYLHGLEANVARTSQASVGSNIGKANGLSYR